MPEPIRIEIYTRPGCHLCDEAKAVIEPFGKRYPIVLTTTNVDSRLELKKRYGVDIPVVFINEKEAFRHRVNGVELERKLKALWNK